jgi:hypothetical protein
MKHAAKTVLIFCLLISPVNVRAACVGYSGPGGPCYTGPGGGLYTGPGGGAYTGPGGGAYTLAQVAGHTRDQAAALIPAPEAGPTQVRAVERIRVQVAELTQDLAGALTVGRGALLQRTWRWKS